MHPELCSNMLNDARHTNRYSICVRLLSAMENGSVWKCYTGNTHHCKRFRTFPPSRSYWRCPHSLHTRTPCTVRPRGRSTSSESNLGKFRHRPEVCTRPLEQKHPITSNHRKTGVNGVWMWIFERAIVNVFNCFMMIIGPLLTWIQK